MVQSEFRRFICGLFYYPGQRENAVESVLDSSMYFVLKIEDGMGKHAFIGLGFTERNEAFDFNVALSDHEKYQKREKDAEEASDESHINIHPAVNHRLKEDETIRIIVKNKPASGAGILSSAGLSGTEKIKPSSLVPPPVARTEQVKPLSLAPPPVASGKIRSPIPPPLNDPAAVRMTSTTHNVSTRNSTDAFTDFSQLERNLPSTGGSGSTQSKSWMGIILILDICYVGKSSIDTTEGVLLVKNRLTSRSKNDLSAGWLQCDPGPLFTPKTFTLPGWLSECCEKEYHVGCLRESGRCDPINGAIQDVVVNGASVISASVSSIINKKHMEKGIIDGAPHEIRWCCASSTPVYL